MAEEAEVAEEAEAEAEAEAEEAEAEATAEVAAAKRYLQGRYKTRLYLRNYLDTTTTTDHYR